MENQSDQISQVFQALLPPNQTTLKKSDVRRLLNNIGETEVTEADINAMFSFTRQDCINE
jgi:hypothetical protein